MNEQRNAISRRWFLGSTVLCGAASLLQPAIAFAQPGHTPGLYDVVEAIQREAEEAWQQLVEMQVELDRASNNYYRALSSQADAQAMMDEAQRRIEGETVIIDQCQRQLSSRAREMYRSGSGTFIDVLVGSISFEEFATGWSMLNKLNAADAELLRRTKQSQRILENARASYAAQSEAAAYEAEEARQVQSRALSTVSLMQEIYDSLSAEAAQIVSQRQLEQASITDIGTITQLVEEATRAVQNGGWTPNEHTFRAPEPESAPEPASEEGIGSIGARAIAVAQQYLGWAYVWGGKAPIDGGFDCSGFVSHCYAQAGSFVPAYTEGLLRWGAATSDPQPGDVCVVHQSNGEQHAGIYFGDGQMVHASTFGVGVIVSPVQREMVFRRV